MSIYKELFKDVEGLNESFEAKAIPLLEAHVAGQIEKAKESLIENHQAELQTLTESHATALAEQAEQANAYGQYCHDQALTENTKLLDKFLNHFLNEWAAENAVAIDGKIKVELAESMLQGMAGLMESHNINVPEGESDTQAKLDEATAKIDELTTEVVELKESASETQRKATLAEALSKHDLTDTQKDRVATLAESFDYSDSFGTQVDSLARSVLAESAGYEDPAQGGEQLNEDVNQPQGQATASDPGMDEILSFMGGGK